MKTYLVPRAVRARFEFSPGFGVSELLAVATGGSLGLGLQWLWALLRIHGPAAFGGRAFVFALPLCSAYMLVRQDAGGSSLLGQVRAALSWMRRPRLYLLPATGVDAVMAALKAPFGWPLRPPLRLAPTLPTVLGKARPAARTPPPPPAVQSWLPVRDVADGVMVRVDGCTVAAVRVLPAPFGLLSDRERDRRIATLHEAIQALPGQAQFISVPRPVDLDGHLADLESRLTACSGARRQLLAAYASYVRALAGGGEVLEHRHHVLIPGEPGGRPEDVRQRAAEFAAALGRAELTAHVCNDQELLDLLFCFLQPLHAALERASAPGSTPRYVTEEEATTDGRR